MKSSNNELDVQSLAQFSEFVRESEFTIDDFDDNDGEQSIKRSLLNDSSILI